MKTTMLKKAMPDWTFKGQNSASLLLHCISPSVDNQLIQKIQILAKSDIDWENLVKLARMHRVLPLLYRQLESVCPSAVPDKLLAKLRYCCQNTTVRNLFMTAELSRLLSLLAERKIDNMPYKGPVVAQSLYEDLSLRQFGDLDIVVQPQNMLAVEQLLIDEGYRPYFGEKSRLELANYMADKNQHTYDFYHDDKKILIEIHWRFWPVFFSSVNPADIWYRRESVSLAGKTVSSLRIEDLLIILCMHGSRHQWERISWICDIARLLKRYPELDWESAIATATQWGSKRMLYLGIYLAYAWLGASLPASVLERVLADSATIHLATQVDEQLFSAEAPKRVLASTRYQIQARERWQDKAACTQSFVYWVLRGRPSNHHST